jgi:hypothetical protein
MDARTRTSTIILFLMLAILAAFMLGGCDPLGLNNGCLGLC